jgi:small subunit ribosomal protein S11
MAKDKLPTVSAEPEKKSDKKSGADKKASYKKKKGKKNVSAGIVHIQASFNNTVITVSDVNGNTIAWSSAGAKGFKGSRKSTPFAAQVAGEESARKSFEQGLRTAVAFVRGPGAGRESALRAFASVGIRITRIQDITPIPHNGCRPPKKRRV